MLTPSIFRLTAFAQNDMTFIEFTIFDFVSTAAIYLGRGILKSITFKVIRLSSALALLKTNLGE